MNPTEAISMLIQKEREELKSLKEKYTTLIKEKEDRILAFQLTLKSLTSKTSFAPPVVSNLLKSSIVHNAVGAAPAVLNALEAWGSILKATDLQKRLPEFTPQQIRSALVYLRKTEKLISKKKENGSNRDFYWGLKEWEDNNGEWNYERT